MLAIVILAVSMIACGASQKSDPSTLTVMETNGNWWSGTLTGAPAPFPSSFPFTFVVSPAPPTGATVWVNWSTTVNVSDTCMNPAGQYGAPYGNGNLPLPANGANFTITSAGGAGSPPFTLTGVVSGPGTGNAVTGTFSLPQGTGEQGCGETPWTVNFTATRTP